MSAASRPAAVVVVAADDWRATEVVGVEDVVIAAAHSGPDVVAPVLTLGDPGLAVVGVIDAISSIHVPNVDVRGVTTTNLDVVYVTHVVGRFASTGDIHVRAPFQARRSRYCVREVRRLVCSLYHRKLAIEGVGLLLAASCSGVPSRSVTYWMGCRLCAPAQEIVQRVARRGLPTTGIGPLNTAGSAWLTGIGTSDACSLRLRHLAVGCHPVEGRWASGCPQPRLRHLAVGCRPVEGRWASGCPQRRLRRWAAGCPHRHLRR